MNVWRMTVLFIALGLASAADAQTTARVRGTITAFDGQVLSVQSRDGKDLKLRMAENATVAAAKAITLNDLKPGELRRLDRDARRRRQTRRARSAHDCAYRPRRSWSLGPGARLYHDERQRRRGGHSLRRS